MQCSVFEWKRETKEIDQRRRENLKWILKQTEWHEVKWTDLAQNSGKMRKLSSLATELLISHDTLRSVSQLLSQKLFLED
jgi:hypothetical protein